MAGTANFVSTSVAAVVFTAWAGNAVADNASAAPTQDALLALEKSAYEAWKSKDAKFWNTYLADNFVGYGSSGKLDKASATAEYSGADCEVKSYALSDEQMKPLGSNAALLTYKSTVDATCGGQKVPAISRVAAVYVREGGKWKDVFHAESAVVDPAAISTNAVDAGEASKTSEAASTARDGGTEAMLAVEKVVWEAWRAHDAKKIEALTAREISFINIFGMYLATKAEALKNWSGEGCDVTSVSVTDAAGTMLSPTVGILTFKGAADGTCYGQKVGPIWGTSIYVKHGDQWKWTFGINVPAPLVH